MFQSTIILGAGASQVKKMPPIRPSRDLASDNLNFSILVLQIPENAHC